MTPMTFRPGFLRAAAAVLVLSGLLVGAPSCGSDGIVGGDCADGYTECNLKCVDLANDPLNCGECGKSCPAGLSCLAGACKQGGLAGASGGGQGGASGAGQGGAAGKGGTGGDAGSAGTSGSAGSAGAGGSCAGKPCGTACVDTTSDPNNCGDCDVVCTTGVCINSLCGCNPPLVDCGGTCVNLTNDPAHCGDCTIVCATGICQASSCVCPTPLVDCSGACIDTKNDPDHCGDCTTVCPTGVCQDSACQGASAGHEVLIGIDYLSVSPVAANKASVRKLLGNAAYLNSVAASGTWKILAYDPFASPSRANATTIVQGEALSHSVTTLTIDVVTDPPTALGSLSVTSYQTFLVFDQPSAPAGEMGSEGLILGNAMRSFAKAGGNVVILSGGTGVNEMWDFAAKAQLFATTGFVFDALNPQPTLVNSSSDVLGQGIASVFSSAPNVGFWQITLDPLAVDVIDFQAGGAIVAVDRSVLP